MYTEQRSGSSGRCSYSRGLYHMGWRIISFVVVLVASSSAIAGQGRPSLAERVHDDGQVCWDPDVEFPVPCDEDDD